MAAKLDMNWCVTAELTGKIDTVLSTSKKKLSANCFL
jgi:hypothetical protein